jgi:hypothetical protein
MGPVVEVPVGSEPNCNPMRKGKVMKKKVGGKQLLPASAKFVFIFMVEVIEWLRW